MTNSSISNEEKILKDYNKILALGFKPIAQLSNLMSEQKNGIALPKYLVNRKGIVYALKNNGVWKTLSHLYFDKEKTKGPVVRIVDQGNKVRNVSVKSLVYLTFSGEHLSEVASGKFYLDYKDGNNNNNSLNNIVALPKKSSASGRKTWNVFNSQDELPPNAITFKPEMTEHDLKNAYFKYNGLFYKVVSFKNKKNSKGILGITMPENCVPDYFLKNLKVKFEQTKRKDAKATFQNKNRRRSVPLSVVLLVEEYSSPRPSYKHIVAYQDGNTYNLSKENIFWELPVEKYKRMRALQDTTGLKMGRGHKNEKHYAIVEDKYFIRGKKLTVIISELGLNEDTYFEFYYHLRKVKKNHETAHSLFVRNLFSSNI